MLRGERSVLLLRKTYRRRDGEVVFLCHGAFLDGLLDGVEFQILVLATSSPWHFLVLLVGHSYSLSPIVALLDRTSSLRRRKDIGALQPLACALIGKFPSSFFERKFRQDLQ